MPDGPLRNALSQRSPRRTSPLPLDAELYKWRHLIENFFCKLKEFKRIAMRADKTDQSFAANIFLAAAVIKLPMNLNRP
jgi:transposase